MSRQPALFGREPALGDLDRVLHRAEHGRGALVLVRGAAGIGKTALVEAAVAGHTVLWGRAVAAEVAPELHLWAQVLRSAGRRGLGAGRGLHLEAVLAAPATADLAGTGQERFLRTDAIIGALRGLAEAGPVVVVLDDVQWADPESLLVVELLAAELLDLPVVVVATVRDDGRPRLPRPDLTIELTGLDAEGAAALLEALAGEAPSADLVAVALGHTGGNPFFLTEVARLLRSRVLDPSAWRGVLPDGVRAVLAQRLDRLPESTRGALEALSVIGPAADLDVVAAVLGLDAGRLDEQIDPALRENLLVARGEGRVEFAHALVREAVLADSRPSAVRRLHDRAARVLEEGRADAATVAGHHLAAGNRAEAARWSAKAGEAAFRRAMYDEAAQWFERAVADDPGPGVAATRLRFADALSRCGRGDDAREQYQAVAADMLGVDDELFGRAALGVGALGGGFEIRLLDQSQVALLTEALDRLGAEPPALVARLQARLSVALTLQEEHGRRLSLAEGAVDLAREAGDPAAVVHALAAWCDANASPVHIDDRLTVSDEMVAAALRSGDPELQLLARRFRIVALMEAGRVVEATAEVAAFARLADALRQPAFRWYARLEEGMLALLHGDLDRAEALAHEAAGEGRAAGSANARMLAEGGLLASVRRERGDAEGFLRILTEANRAHAEANRGTEFLYPIFLVGWGVDHDTVRAILARLPGDLSWADHDALFLQVWTSLGDAAAYVGDEMWLPRAEARLAPFADRLALDGTASVCVGAVSATLARLAAARGDATEAGGHFDRALLLLDTLDAPLLRERVLRDRAQLDLGPSPGGGPTRSPHAAGNRFAREGETWWLAFGGAETRLRDTKGLHDLAVLLARPGEEVHCLDLVAAAEGGTSRGRPVDRDLGPALDATARAAYEARIVELTESIEDAEAVDDVDRAARLDEERAQLLRALAGALGMSGRARPQGSDAERARKAVAMRVRDALARIDHELPELARHLRNAVRTGTFCAYEPERPVDWQL